jgi:hypothetical protein
MDVRRGWGRLWIPVVALSVVVLASLACGEAAETSEPRVSTATPETEETPAGDEATSTSEPEPAPTDTAEPEVQYLGDVVEEQGYLLCAVTVEDPTTPGMFYQEEAGQKLVGVEIIVGNASGEPLSVNPLYATLLDSEGYTYEVELAGRDRQIGSVTLSTGEKASGWVAFELPEGATPATIKYAPDLFGGTVLRASLEAPPEGYVPDTTALSIVPAASEAGLGDVLEQYGYSLSATAVEDPTTPGMFYQATPGYRLVAVEIIVGNVSGETLSCNPLYSTLVDSRGYVYGVELAGRDGQLATVDLGPGEKARGWVAFEVPDDATPASVKYEVDIWSGEFLRVGLGE